MCVCVCVCGEREKGKVKAVRGTSDSSKATGKTQSLIAIQLDDSRFRDCYLCEIKNSVYRCAKQNLDILCKKTKENYHVSKISITAFKSNAFCKTICGLKHSFYTENKELSNGSGLFLNTFLKIKGHIFSEFRFVSLANGKKNT